MTVVKKINEAKARMGTSSTDHHIHPSVLFHIALRNFVAKKLRSFLTVFGVVIGVSAISFLLSFGIGIQNLVTNQVIGDRSLKSIDVDSPNSKIINLNEDVVNDIRKYGHVQGVGVEYSFPGIASLKGGEIDAVVYGTDRTYQDLSNLVISSGRLLTKDDNKAVVVNEAILQSLGIPNAKDALGKDIEVNVPLDKFSETIKNVKNTYTIVGVVSSTTGNEVYLPSSIFEVAGVSSYNHAKIVADDMSNVENIRRQVEAKGFQTTSLTDTLTEINNIFQIFNIVLVGVGSIGMIVAVLGMFNTLTISLLERTREIGLMMALGARRRDMKKLFVLEAVIISFAGSIIGLVVAFLLSRAVNVGLNLSAQSRGVNEWFELFAAPPLMILSIITATILVGLAVVYFPAKRAEKINPIDALRRE